MILNNDSTTLGSNHRYADATASLCVSTESWRPAPSQRCTSVLQCQQCFFFGILGRIICQSDAGHPCKSDRHSFARLIICWPDASHTCESDRHSFARPALHLLLWKGPQPLMLSFLPSPSCRQACCVPKVLPRTK